MKVSYNWLNDYVSNKLPNVESAVEALTMHSAEVDSIEKVGKDSVLDVKTTPNMAHSCLCHRGIAREFSAILNLPIKKYSKDFKEFKIAEVSKRLKVKISDEIGCRRYIGRIIENVKIGDSPVWLKDKLESLGQRSINNLVDATNFVMLEIGQPMHVFDAEKIIGDIIEIKKAKNGDKMTTLDNKSLDLDETILTISNNNKALAIAGVKGGTLAEIDKDTKNIILESANFDPVLIRKTAQKLKIQTDASKRYENEITPILCEEAMDILTKLIVEIAGTKTTKVGEIVDAYPNPTKKITLGISVDEVEKILGLKISEKEIEAIFKRFNFEYKKVGNEITINVPPERLDLRIKQDLVEEVGRIFGYGKLRDDKKIISEVKGEINKSFYYSNKIKQILSDLGFSEIYGYTFTQKGDIEIANSVSPDRKYLRSSLAENMTEYLEFNARYSELSSMPQIKIFEIGKIFKIGDEHNNLSIGVKTPIGTRGLPKDVDVLKEAAAAIENGLGVKIKKINLEDNIIECNFDELIQKLSQPKSYDIELPMAKSDMRFKKISTYPFMLRDVAVFTPSGIKSDDVLSIIKKDAGDLLMKYRLFDVFTKGEKTSYAFRLVFQSYEKTLSDDEINKIMDKITKNLNSNSGWQVR